MKQLSRQSARNKENASWTLRRRAPKPVEAIVNLRNQLEKHEKRIFDSYFMAKSQANKSIKMGWCFGAEMVSVVRGFGAEAVCQR